MRDLHEQACPPNVMTIPRAPQLARLETPAVVLADVGAGVKPTDVPFARAIFKVASFAAAALRVRMIASDAPETSK
jgi:hypothetical protein